MFQQDNDPKKHTSELGVELVKQANVKPKASPDLDPMEDPIKVEYVPGKTKLWT